MGLISQPGRFAVADFIEWTIQGNRDAIKHEGASWSGKSSEMNRKKMQCTQLKPNQV